MALRPGSVLGPRADSPALQGLPLLNPPESARCFVCGDHNPRGMSLRVHADGTDAVALYTPGDDDSGYPDRMHGGLVAALLDEMLVYAGVPHGLWGVTARVSYALRRPIPLGTPLTLRGQLTRRSARGFRATASARLPEGTLAAEGEGTCVVPAAPPLA
jgi:acyl-coenzyme A thioesterase PaaI-like protein